MPEATGYVVAFSNEVRSGVTGHMMILEATSTGRCDPKLQLMWQCVKVRPASYLDFELICGVPGI
jgi:hypothetical protein